MLFNEDNNYYDYDTYEYDIDKLTNKYNDVDINIDSINFNRNDSLYSTKDGFNKGNMFKNLYSKYKDYVYKLSVNNKKDELLYNIQMYGFAMKDMNLYLDIYPNDKDALSSFYEYKSKYDSFKKQYENEYGPLCMNDVINKDKWTWVNNPWPFDKGGNK